MRMAFLLSGSAIHRPSMGFRATPVIVRRPQGRVAVQKLRFQEEPLAGRSWRKADLAERATGGRINRSTIAFSQNLIDQSNECF
jgi:hypothetical protein